MNNCEVFTHNEPDDTQRRHLTRRTSQRKFFAPSIQWLPARQSSLYCGSLVFLKDSGPDSM